MKAWLRKRALPRTALAVVSGVAIAVGLLLPSAPRAARPQNFEAASQALFLYDRALIGQPVWVAVADEAGASDIVRAFAARSVKARIVKELLQTDAPVIYVNRPTQQLKEHCVRRKILSISGVHANAERGDVSVALGPRPDGKPAIVVNHQRMAAEGHALEAKVLDIARVIR